MKPDLIDFISFVLLTAAFLAACRFTKYSKAKRRKSPLASILLPPIERRPIPCKLCPIHGVTRKRKPSKEVP